MNSSLKSSAFIINSDSANNSDNVTVNTTHADSVVDVVGSNVTVTTENANCIIPATSKSKAVRDWMAQLDAIEFPSPPVDYKENERMTFAKLCNTIICDKKSCIRWLMSMGLLVTNRSCPACGEPMKLKKSHDSTDCCTWLCKKQIMRKRHFKTVSLRTGSWFQGSHLTLEKILKLTYIWANGYSSAVAHNEVGIGAETQVDWFYYCREVCEVYLLEMSQPIGGPDTIVEIYESDFIKPKCSKEDGIKNQWVYGGIEQNTSNVFFVPVDDKKEKTLCSFVSKWIKPGTTIYSDCWESFTKLNKMGYQHRTLNKYSSDSKSNNAIEGKWHKARNSLPVNGTHKKCLSGYIAENLWRMKIRDRQDKFLAFLEATKYMCNPGTLSKVDGSGNKNEKT